MMSRLNRLALVCLLSWCGRSGELLAQQELASYKIAQPDYQWSFPRDHGSHPGFKIEWWYYTGQLWPKGREPFRDPPSYGFQLTFFRKQLDPSRSDSSEYMAHAVLTDLNSGTSIFASRQGGGALGVAGASLDTLDVWAGDWFAQLFGETHVLRFSTPNEGGAAVRLLASPSAYPWLQGVGGFSRKGECANCASQYYSLPRIDLNGDVQRGAISTPVTGVGWMDHEFMTNSLDTDQVGWDWFGLMLKDGRNLTIFRLRKKDGSSSFTSASIIDRGEIRSVRGEDVKLTSTSVWESPKSKGRYPLSWRVEIPSAGIDLSISARVKSCEVGGRVSGSQPWYWEGPVASADEAALGYLEMTGYVEGITL